MSYDIYFYHFHQNANPEEAKKLINEMEDEDDLGELSQVTENEWELAVATLYPNAPRSKNEIRIDDKVGLTMTLRIVNFFSCNGYILNDGQLDGVVLDTKGYVNRVLGIKDEMVGVIKKRYGEKEAKVPWWKSIFK